MANETYLIDLIRAAAARLNVPEDRVRFTFEMESDGSDAFGLYCVAGLLDTEGRLTDIAAGPTPQEALDRLCLKVGSR